MHALIGADEPASALVGEVRVPQEGPAVEEIAPEVADRPLDLALRLGAVGSARPDPKAPVGREAQELGILEEPAPGRAVVVEDHALHLIEEDLVGHAAEGREGPLEAQHHGEGRLARHELDREHARVPEDDQEGEALAPRQADLGEIELGLLAGRGFKPDDWLGLEPRADAGHVGFQLAVAAGVPRGAALLEQPHGRQRGVGRQPLLKQWLVAIEFRRSGRGTARGRGPAQLTIELTRPDPMVDRPATDAELPSDRGLRESRLQIMFEQHEGIPSVHGLAPPTRSSQAPKEGAPTSGPTPDTQVCNPSRRFCAI